MRTFQGVEQTGVEFLEQNLGELYFLSWTTLRLDAWVNMKRTRVWLFLVRRDLGTQAIADLARDYSLRIEEGRRELGAPQSMDECLYPIGSPEWHDVMIDVHARKQQGKPYQGGEKWRAWPEKQRQLWREQGFSVVESPLAEARFSGLKPTPREREVCEVSLLQATWKAGGSAECLEDVKLTAKGFTQDVSQNIRNVFKAPVGASSTHRPAASMGSGGCPEQEGDDQLDTDLAGSTTSCGSLCKTWLLYSYSADRLVHPREVLRALGWTDPVVEGLSWASLQDLVGEAQGVPCAATAQWAMLYAVGRCLPDLFAHG